MIKKVSKRITIIIAIMLIGGLGGIIADRYFFPYLSTTDYFKKHDFLKRASEEVTVINKTEQVFVKEDTSISKISSQASSAVVSIISYPATDAKMAVKKSSNGAAVKYGTGLIITSDGLIVTYADAINMGTSKYKVVTHEGNSYDAEISSTDTYSNLVFLKIDASNLAVASFGNSADINPGEKIIAIGAGAANTQYEYASGLVSKFNAGYNLSGQAVSSSEKLEGVFESDLVLNSDYIGGPIIDYAGHVSGIIGVNQISNGQKFFEIPSNKVGLVIDRAIKKETNYPTLGIYYMPLTQNYALANNLSNTKGALIFSASGQVGLAIIAGSPAQKVGLQLNDIITKVNDQEIDENNTLPDLMYRYSKGDTVELTVLRAGAEMKISVQL
jgi:S1-C subfamily serine protease